MRRDWDAVVVGGGPGGLATAFWLGRYRRRTLVLDTARPRNEQAWAVHGFPGLDDVSPVELRRRLRHQAMGAGALVERRAVARVTGQKDAFQVDDDRGSSATARRVVLAYGRTDWIPEIPGLQDFYGTSVFHCPDCDGPSIGGCEVGVLGHDAAAARVALYLLTWASRVVLLTNGLELDVEPHARATLQRHDVVVHTAPIERVQGHDGDLEEICLTSQPPLPMDALFFHWGSSPATDLAGSAGCQLLPTGDIVVDRDSMETSVPGLHAVGDIVGRPHLAISAAADGVRAALAIHRSLLPDEFLL
jgi:thioredoxin reductase